MRRGVLGAALGFALLGAAPAQAADYEVVGRDSLDFFPAEVVIAPDDIVTWTFPNTAQTHNVAQQGSSTGDAAWAAFNPEPAFPAPNQTFQFKVEGTYNFVCTVHATTMTGKVTVTKAPEAVPAPTPVPPSQQPFANDATAPVAPETAVALDTSKPGLASLSVKRVAKGARVRFKVSEESVVSVRVKRAGRLVKSASVAGVGARNLTVRGLRAGRYVVQVRATDLAGNRSKTRTLRVTVR